jgi:O-acetyl-ADP-ribose deacetylase (regulator of RNase III)
MQYKEVKMDLFKMPEEYYLAHCISTDLKMGAGIAVQFEKIFGIRKQIDSKRTSTLFPTCILSGRVFNLITKSKYYEKPSYLTLTDSLICMRKLIIENNITKIAIPKIGCGLDGLRWYRVKEIIFDIFEDMDIEIVVCYI